MPVFEPGQENVPLMQRRLDESGIVCKAGEFIIHLQAHLFCLIHGLDYEQFMSEIKSAGGK